MTDFLRRACPICRSSDAHDEVASRRRAETLPLDALRDNWWGVFDEKLFFTYHRCAGCGLLYNPVYFDNDHLAGLYAHMEANMNVVSTEAIVATQRGYFERAAATAELDGGYLEIGPDAGYIVAEAAHAGAFEHFWLFEPNLAIHEALRKAVGDRPATLLPDMDDLSAVPDGSVGLAVMIQVLDHLLDPLATLEQVRSKLRPGGTLMIVTHNEQSLLRKAVGTRWPAFCLQHPQLYNPHTMNGILKRAGYAEIAVEGSRNHFPIDFLARQAALAIGIKLTRVPLPAISVELKLGNLLTLASAPAVAATPRPREAAA